MSRLRLLPSDDPLDAFEAELLSGGIATLVLERWRGGRVHAEVVSGAAVTPTAEQCARLLLNADDIVTHRRVRLMHGDVILSEADNWYVPARLTPEINEILAGSDTPFGVLIRPLAPVRRTLSVERDGNEMLRVAALVVDGAGVPLAEVAETYRLASLRG